MDLQQTNLSAPDSSPAQFFQPFFLGLGRAMVSLGPLTPNRYCPFRCQFCYVQGPFPKYQRTDVPEIIEWLRQHRTHFNIVYVSGDTDSFAPPRTTMGFDLLRALLELETDVLFTTRHLFSNGELRELETICQEYEKRDKLLVACVSISQLFHPKLEPHPIATPQSRLKQLIRFKSMGLTSVLTIRPLIPSIPASEYVQIAADGYANADLILAGDLYLDPNGEIERSIADATSSNYSKSISSHKKPLDFSLDNESWTIVRHDQAIIELKQFCSEVGAPFFLRSQPAIDWIRSRNAERRI